MSTSTVKAIPLEEIVVHKGLEEDTREPQITACQENPLVSPSNEILGEQEPINGTQRKEHSGPTKISRVPADIPEANKFLYESQEHQITASEENPLISRLEKILEAQEPEDDTQMIEHSGPTKISRVPADIPEANKNLYVPQMVSIGPYCHRLSKIEGNQLSKMEDHKRRLYRSFVSRKSEIAVGTYVKELKDLEKSVRESYSADIEIESDEFIEMLLLEGCFILELFLMWEDQVKDILFEDGGLTTILTDFLLYENQIPVFVIEKLYEISVGEEGYDRDKFLGRLSNFLREKQFDWWDNEDWPQPILHLPEVYHHSVLRCFQQHVDFWDILTFVVVLVFSVIWLPILFTGFFIYIIILIIVPSRYEFIADWIIKANSLIFDPFVNLSEWITMFIHWIYKLICRICELIRRITTRDNQLGEERLLQIPSATELVEVGVKFRKMTWPMKLFDVTFERGYLEFPLLQINHNTMALIANLVELERHKTWEDRIVTSYVAMMESLMKKKEDVVLLRDAGVIDNMLLSDEEAMRFFYQCHDRKTFNSTKHYLHELFRNVQLYYISGWNRTKAALFRDYCKNIWTTLSVISAIILLGLTTLQAVYTVLLYYHPH